MKYIVPVPIPRPTLPGATAAPVTSFPTTSPTISMAPTRYWPSVTIEMAVATQVLIFTKEGGHIRVGTTIWTRSDYLLDAVIWSASQLLRERLTAEGLEVEDFLDDDAWATDDELVPGARNRRLDGATDGAAVSAPTRPSALTAQDGLFPAETPDRGVRRLVVNGTVLELDWDKSTVTHLALDELESNPNLTKEQRERLGVPGISWQKVTLKYWMSSADEPETMFIEKKTVRLIRKITTTFSEALADGNFLAWAQYADPKIAGLSEVGAEHAATIQMLDLPISPFSQPIETGSLDAIRIAGIVLLILGIVGTSCIAITAKRKRRKREDKAFWGRLETDKDIDALLNVGLIHTPHNGESGGKGSQRTSRNGTSPHDNSSDEEDIQVPTYVPGVLARPMGQSELGYSNDNSMLMGGYQRTMHMPTSSASTPSPGDKKSS